MMSATCHHVKEWMTYKRCRIWQSWWHGVDGRKSLSKVEGSFCKSPKKSLLRCCAHVPPQWVMRTFFLLLYINTACICSLAASFSHPLYQEHSLCFFLLFEMSLTAVTHYTLSSHPRNPSIVDITERDSDTVAFIKIRHKIPDGYAVSLVDPSNVFIYISRVLSWACTNNKRLIHHDMI